MNSFNFTSAFNCKTSILLPCALIFICVFLGLNGNDPSSSPSGLPCNGTFQTLATFPSSGKFRSRVKCYHVPRITMTHANHLSMTFWHLPRGHVRTSHVTVPPPLIHSHLLSASISSICAHTLRHTPLSLLRNFTGGEKKESHCCVEVLTLPYYVNFVTLHFCEHVCTGQNPECDVSGLTQFRLLENLKSINPNTIFHQLGQNLVAVSLVAQCTKKCQDP